MKTSFLILSFTGLLLYFLSCTNQNTQKGTSSFLTEEEQASYFIKGEEIVLKSFAALGGQLQKAMKEGGVPHAISYCNTVAYPLIDSLSKVHQATIRRTSLKVRNPKDKPTEWELKILKEYEVQAANNKPLESVLVTLEEGTAMYFAPIKIQPLCLQCHGKVGEELKEENYALLKNLYPDDEAIGYKNGELRGMWSVRF